MNQSFISPPLSYQSCTSIVPMQKYRLGGRATPLNQRHSSILLCYEYLKFTAGHVYDLFEEEAV